MPLAGLKDKPKTLVLASRFPYPLTGGDRLRVYHFLKILSQEFDVDLLALHSPMPPSDDVDHLKSFVREVLVFPVSPFRSRLSAVQYAVTRSLPLQVGYYMSNEANRWIRDNIQRYDLVFCFHVRMTEYVIDLKCKKVVDLVDAISMNYAGALNSTPDPLWRLVYRAELPRLIAYERNVIANFDRAMVISPVDKAFLVSHGSHEDRISIVPNGTDLANFSLQNKREGDIDILFHGNMATQANQSAAIHLVKEILPLIRTKGIDPVVYIVGTSPRRKIRQLSDGKRVVVTGQVSDVTPYILRAKTIVAPMLFGAGVQNKILEAMALAKPVVTSTNGAEGIEGIAGVHYLVADDPSEFSSALLSLLGDKGRRDSIGNAARKLIQEKYTWESIRDRLLGELNRVLMI